MAEVQATEASKKPATKKVAKKKAETKKAEPKIDSRKITVLVEENPKKKGSEAHKRFGKYKTGMTVTEALAAGVKSLDIAYDAKKKFISLSK